MCVRVYNRPCTWASLFSSLPFSVGFPPLSSFSAISLWLACTVNNGIFLVFQRQLDSVAYTALFCLAISLEWAFGYDSDTTGRGWLSCQPNRTSVFVCRQRRQKEREGQTSKARGPLSVTAVMCQIRQTRPQSLEGLYCVFFHRAHAHYDTL